MKKLYIIVITVLLTNAAFAQAPIMSWGHVFGDGDTNYVRSICADPAGNIYVGGIFAGEFDFDPGSGVATRSSHNLGSGSTDGFVAKYSADGTFQWVAILGGDTGDAVYSIAADNSGVYVTGYYSNTAEFDEDGSVTEDAPGNLNAYIAKYNASNGNLAFVRSIGAELTDVGNAITLDKNSNIYLTGSFMGTVQFDESGQDPAETAIAESDMFLAKFTSAGGYLWSDAIGSDGTDVASAIHLEENTVWIGGYYNSFLYADPNDFTTGLGCVGGYNGYLGQYNSDNGNLLWGGYVRSPGDDFVSSIEVDDYSVYAGGYFSQSAEIFGDLGTSKFIYSNGFYDAYVFRLSADTKELSWANSFGSASGYEYVESLAVIGGNIYVTGPFGGDSDVDPSGFNTYYLFNSSNTLDAYIVAYNWAYGDFVSALQFGNETGAEEPTTMAVSNGSLLWGGGFSSTGVDIDASGTGEQFESSQGGYDAFIERLDPAEPYGDPTDMTFPANLETYVEVLFTPYMTRPDGYLTLVTIGADPTGVPQDNTLYKAGDMIGNSKVLYTSISEYTAFTALPGAEYHLAVYPYNGEGQNINFKTDNPLRGEVTTPGTSTDTQAPTIVDNSPTKTAPNTDVKLTVTVNDPSGVFYVNVTYESIDELEMSSDYMYLKEGTTNVYEYIVDKSFVSAQGMEYFIVVEDNYGNNNIGTGVTVKSVVVEHSGEGISIPYVGGTTQTAYKIVSLPLDLGTKNSVKDIFEDDLLTYDKTKYRIFRYNGNTNDELNSSSKIEMGRGYWFLAAETKTLDTGPGTTVVAGYNKPVFIPVTNGWNQIGNPFLIDIPWSLIQSHPDNNSIVFNGFKTYENGWNTNATTLKAFSGGFVMIQSGANSGKLRIPMYEEDNDGGRHTPPVAVNFQQSLSADTWAVDLHVRSGAMENLAAGFGMHPNAKEQNDIYDDFTLPRFLDYIELNYNKTLFGSPFTKDIVPTSAQQVWEFKVESNLADELVEITWDNSYFGSTDLQLVLWDVELQRAIDMKAENTYSFNRSQSGNFKVFFGDAAFVKKETLPHNPVFHSVSPVPSSGNVTFDFSLPESANNTRTNLVVYNLLGQKVANLVDKPLAAGYHQAVWNIEDGVKPATGVYISVLKFGDTTLQKRLIIK